MSSNIDMSKWPKAWKDQYNQVIRERKLEQRLDLLKAEEQDRSLFPKIWKMELDEEAVFAFLSHSFPLDRVISRVLQKFISPKKKDTLQLSWRYLFETEGISPGHYSDRERTVVLFNRFKSQGRDWENLFYWVSCLSEKKNHPHIHLLLGMMFLDHYLRNLNQAIWLHQAIKHLGLVERSLVREDCTQALKAMLAFCFYLNRDFDTSLSYLEPRHQKPFDEDFKLLIKKVA